MEARIRRNRQGAGGRRRPLENAERLAKYDFSDPIYVENIAVYYRQVRPLEFRSVYKAAGKGDLLACFNKALAEMKIDGSFDRIVREELGR